MEAAFSEMPLAIFTTLAPIGAGAFIALCVAFYTHKFTEEELKRIDKMSFVPFVLAAIGFIASMLHLANPAAAMGAFSNIGSSPLSNEICIGIIFMVVALVYLIMAVTGKLSEGARKGFVTAVAILAAVFALFTGLAYMIPTVTSWATPLNCLQTLGYALAGGAAFAPFLIGANSTDAYLKAMKGVSIAGVVLAVIGVLGQVAITNGAANAAVTGSALVSGAMAPLVIGIILIAVACVLTIRALPKSSMGVALTAICASVVGVFCLRLVFYALQISVGLSL